MSALRKGKAVSAIAKQVRWVIRIAGVGAVFVYSFLRFSELPFDQFVGTHFSEIIFSVTLMLYYTSWIIGAPLDATLQESAVAYVDRGDRLTKSDYEMIGLLFVIFIVLCSLRDGREFFIALGVFWAMNIVGYRHMIKKQTQPKLDDSKSYYAKRRQWLDLYYALIVEDYIAGKWQMTRFYTGFVVIGIAIIVAFTPIQDILIQSTILKSQHDLWAIMALFFVVFAEGWMWLCRIKTKFQVDLLEQMHEECCDVTYGIPNKFSVDLLQR